MLNAKSLQRQNTIDRNLIERRIRAIWSCRAAGDFDGLRKYLAPDCVYIANTWIGHPATLRREGREACIDVVRQIHILLEVLEAETAELVIDGEQAAACRRTKMRNRGSGEVATLDICHFLRFRDGLLVEMTERTDTLGMIRLCGE